MILGQISKEIHADLRLSFCSVSILRRQSRVKGIEAQHLGLVRGFCSWEVEDFWVSSENRRSLFLIPHLPADFLKFLRHPSLAFDSLQIVFEQTPHVPNFLS